MPAGGEGIILLLIDVLLIWNLGRSSKFGLQVRKTRGFVYEAISSIIRRFAALVDDDGDNKNNN